MAAAAAAAALDPYECMPLLVDARESHNASAVYAAVEQGDIERLKEALLLLTVTGTHNNNSQGGQGGQGQDQEEKDEQGGGGRGGGPSVQETQDSYKSIDTIIRNRREQGTALAWSVKFDKPEVTRFLLEQDGADPNIRESGRNGQTPLMIAVELPSLHMAAMLVAHGADVNARTYRSQQSVLHFAATAKETTSKDMVQLLVDAGADLNHRDDRGDRPGDIAADFRRFPLASFLSPSLWAKRAQFRLRERVKNRKRVLQLVDTWTEQQIAVDLHGIVAFYLGWGQVASMAYDPAWLGMASMDEVRELEQQQQQQQAQKQ